MSRAPSDQPAAEESFEYRGAGRLPAVSDKGVMVKGGLQGHNLGLGAHGPWRIQPPHSQFPCVGEGGYEDGGPQTAV